MKNTNRLYKISEVINRFNLKPKKSLSQNFLLDLNLTEKIVKTMGKIDSHDILEIGPGPGSLTRSLLDLGARKVVAIEKDDQFLGPLKEINQIFPGKLQVINKDVLGCNIESLLSPPIKIVSNLPYNIGTEILLNFISNDVWPPFWDSLTLMFQKEVADRIISQPGTKSYGRLSIISQWRTKVKVLFTIKASSFVPAPKIDSSIVQFIPRQTPIYEANQKSLEDIVKKAFGQRRKMLRQSLKSVDKNIEAVLTKVNIYPTSRPEELTIKNFCDIANALDNLAMKR